jgi:isonocardicin synthase
LFCRFLNSEVVSTGAARQILPRLAATLRPGAVMVLLGHSPVLLDTFDLNGAGLRVLRTTARMDDYVFQYYVCQNNVCQNNVCQNDAGQNDACENGGLR